jgi:hypothetical protein
MNQYTKEQRQAFVKLLEGSKATLWNGKGNKGKQNIYICLALEEAWLDGFATQGDVETLCREIDHRLGNWCSMSTWLLSQGIPRADITMPALQAHRLAWINLMIEEFSK